MKAMVLLKVELTNKISQQLKPVISGENQTPRTQARKKKERISESGNRTPGYPVRISGGEDESG